MVIRSTGRRVNRLKKQRAKVLEETDNKNKARTWREMLKKTVLVVVVVVADDDGKSMMMKKKVW